MLSIVATAIKVEHNNQEVLEEWVESCVDWNEDNDCCVTDPSDYKE